MPARTRARSSFTLVTNISAHRPLYRIGGRPVQGLLEGLMPRSRVEGCVRLSAFTVAQIFDFFNFGLETVSIERLTV
jgi:hypothetical protein